MKLKRLLLPVVAVCLLLSACGKKAEEPAEPEQEAWEEAAEEEETVCDHVFAEATYHAPKTCTICGETEGDVKPSYFEELGVQVDPVPVDREVNVYVEVEEDPDELSYITPGLFHVESITEEPQGDGTVLVTMVSKISYDVCYEDDWWNQNVMTHWFDGLYDYYTGKHFEHDDMIGRSYLEYSVEVSYDDEDYTIEYSMNNEWDKSDYWYDDHSSNQTFFCTKTTTVRVPEGYDGIVYAIFEACGAGGEEESFSEYFDPDLSVYPYVDGVYLFRVNPADYETGSVTAGSTGSTAAGSVSVTADVQEKADLVMKMEKPEIDLDGKEEKLKKLGFEVNKYETQYLCLERVREDGWIEQVRPEICNYMMLDPDNGIAYQYVWSYGILCTLGANNEFHEYWLDGGQENTCSTEELAVLYDVVKNLEALYEEVK